MQLFLPGGCSSILGLIECRSVKCFDCKFWVLYRRHNSACIKADDSHLAFINGPPGLSTNWTKLPSRAAHQPLPNSRNPAPGRRLQTDGVVDCRLNPLLAPQIAPSGLHGDMSQKELDLLQLAPRYVAYRMVAEDGDADAQYCLGVYYENGQGVPRDDVWAMRWYRRAAYNGVANAWDRLGIPYVGVEDIPSDDTGAVYLYRKAADGRNADAQYMLGVLLENGEGVPRDDVEALRLYRKAAEQGLADAQCALGLRCVHGWGVAQDDAEAVRWYRLAAEQGNADAQFHLGYAYYSGRGVPPDFVEAARWYRLAAEQGFAPAQSNLGYLYAVGHGVERDNTQAAYWCLKARSIAFGKTWGWLNAQGDSIPDNQEDDIVWWLKAAEQGHVDAQYLYAHTCCAGEGAPPDNLDPDCWVDSAVSGNWYVLNLEQAVEVRECITGSTKG